jgi:intein-encoded DNA endonuclease-like protein
MSSVITEKGSQLRHSTSYEIFLDEGKAKPVLSVDYIVGLADGEGCFYVNVPTSRRYEAGARVELSFHIKLKAHDREVLERVKETLVSHFFSSIRSKVRPNEKVSRCFFR